jgi:ABC-type siderophore export system fused ATPase/permease subunit
MNPRAAVPAVAAATFLAAFGAAELTGVRAIGGIVLVAGGAWCAWAALRLSGRAATAALVAIALALFVVSHPLGQVIGAWPAVILSAVGVATAAALLLARTEATRRASTIASRSRGAT